MGLLEKANGELRSLFKTYSIDKSRFLQALQTVRGNTQVQSDNPEETYDVLKKYGQDLVELARQQQAGSRHRARQ